MSANSPSRGATRALVLGGGGPVGRAWESGLAAGLLAHGVDLDRADLIVGTSAGAIVGAELALGLDLDAFGPVIDSPDGAVPASLAPAGMQRIRAATIRALTSSEPEAELKEVGQLALTAETCTEEESLARETFAPAAGKQWPRNFAATAVDTQSGQLQLWSAASGVALDRAIASSSALPSVWPPITIGGRRYMDGGVRSSLNADLASGYGRVVVVSCFSLDQPTAANPPMAALNRSLRAEIESLQSSGSTVEVVVPNREFIEMTANGARMLDNSLVPDAHEAGRRQAVEDAKRIRAIWHI